MNPDPWKAEVPVWPNETKILGSEELLSSLGFMYVVTGIAGGITFSQGNPLLVGGFLETSLWFLTYHSPCSFPYVLCWEFFCHSLPYNLRPSPMSSSQSVYLGSKLQSPINQSPENSLTTLLTTWVGAQLSDLLPKYSTGEGEALHSTVNLQTQSNNASPVSTEIPITAGPCVLWQDGTSPLRFLCRSLQSHEENNRQTQLWEGFHRIPGQYLRS